MRIVYLEPAGKGGMIHYAFQLCRALAAVGADVTLVTARNYELAHLLHPFTVEPSLEIWDPKSNVRVPWLWRKLRRIGRAFRHYREWLRQIRRVKEIAPDVVLLGDIRFPFDLFPLILLRRRARKLADLCHNVHSFSAAGSFSRSRWRAFFYRRIYRLFDRVFVHFDRNRGEFRHSFGIDPAVIVHGNEEIFRDLRKSSFDAAALRAHLGIPKDAPVVLFFGTLSRYKGIDVLLDAFPAIRKDSDAHLVLAGFPAPDFDLRAHESRSGGGVIWVPSYIASDEVAAWMELASVIVFPYRDISQSGALHVAQTFGVPIVASAIGTMRDVIEHDVSGLLVEPENADALANAVKRLLRDRALAQRLGARAADDARGKFAWTTIASKILEECAA